MSNDSLIDSFKAEMEKNGYHPYSQEMTDGVDALRAAMGTPDGSGKALAEFGPLPSPTQPSEISVIGAGFDAAIAGLGACDDEFNKWHLDEGELRWFAAACYEKPKPVSASLEGCAKALWGDRETPWEDAGKTAQKEYRRQTKAVLDAAGVKYAE